MMTRHVPLIKHNWGCSKLFGWK